MALCACVTCRCLRREVIDQSSTAVQRPILSGRNGEGEGRRGERTDGATDRDKGESDGISWIYNGGRLKCISMLVMGCSRYKRICSVRPQDGAAVE